MRFPTTIGTIVLETDWRPLIAFLEVRDRLPALEAREIQVRVDLVERSEIQVLGDDPPDSYPRRAYIENCEFTISRDRILGRVPKDLVQVGLVIEWLWYLLPICCAPEGWQTMHAAAVEREGEVTLIFGQPQAGKTFAALEMTLQGWNYFADDIVLVDHDGHARGWDSSWHVDPDSARLLGVQSQIIDFCGKLRVPGRPRTNQGRIDSVLLAGDEPIWHHVGPGFDSGWVENDLGEYLIALGKPLEQPRLDGLRVAFLNRDPDGWFGGDLVHTQGYIDGLKHLGVQAELVPCDELDESQYDLLHLMHAQYPWSQMVAAQTTRPLVVSAITQHHPPIGDVEAAVERAGAVLCYSSLEADYYAGLRAGWAGKMRVVPLGVPAALYRGEAVQPRRSAIHAGAYLPVKNMMASLQACRQLDIPIVFAGPLRDGNHLRDLRRAAGNWRGVRFLGQLSGEALWRRMREAHVILQPSLWEAGGLSMLEGLASGCNGVMTEVGWGRPVFEPHCSMVAPDMESVRNALLREIDQPRDRHGFRPPTWEIAARALIPVYREVLNGVRTA